MTNEVERLHEFLSYDPDTGEFRWKKLGKAWRGIKVGQLAGGPDDKGYLKFRLEGRMYRAHRVAWLFMTGEWPNGHIDHIDGNPSNNRFDNMRIANDSQNQGNKKVATTSKSGIKGVRRLESGRWQAYIKINRKRKSLGCFTTADAAVEAYKQAAVAVYGEFARVSIRARSFLSSIAEKTTPATAQDETGWLIELKGQTPQWAVINPLDYDEHWTTDASKALRFAREQDAQAYIDHIGWTEAFPTEHMWCGPREKTTPATDREGR